MRRPRSRRRCDRRSARRGGVDPRARSKTTASAPGVLKSASMAALKASTRSAVEVASRSVRGARTDRAAQAARGLLARCSMPRTVLRRRPVDDEGQRRAVVGLQQVEAHLHRLVALEDEREGEEVLRRVGHLLAVDGDQAGVHPVPHERHLAGAAPRSGRSRSRGAGRSGRRRRRGCRSGRRASRATIAEHSMCQPGRPRPHGLGQDGSPGLARFHRAKSRGSRLPGSSSLRAATSWLLRSRRLSLP